MAGMPRRFLALLLLVPELLALAACQSTSPSHSDAASASPTPDGFNSDTDRTYDPQTHEFEARPPFGAQSNRDE
jgi:hypothetical protein